MELTVEQLSAFDANYKQASKFVNEESKQDPENEPYRSHYKARDILEDMKRDLKNRIIVLEAEGDCDKKVDFYYRVILGTVYCKLGRLYCYTEEVSSGESYLKDCISLLHDFRLHREAVIPYIKAMNELSCVCANRQNYKEALERLNESEELYLLFNNSGHGNPLTIYDIFNNGREIEVGKGLSVLENLYTHCSFYMAQVYGQLGQLQKSALYCHKTLKRQLEAKSYDSLDFFLNTATLSQYFIGQKMFPEARHHLAAATKIMNMREGELIKPDMTDEEIAEAQETQKHRAADVARCWAKYGLALLSASKERLYKDDDEDEDAEPKPEELTKDVEQLSIAEDQFKFPDIDLSAYEKRVTADYCLDFDDAKKVFAFTIQWLDKAKAYYTPDSEASEYANIIRDYAELHSLIAFFEEDPENQYKMHKRQVKYYEDILELLNPIFYMNIVRGCWYSASMAYSHIINYKLDTLQEAGAMTKKSDITKINQIMNKSIDYFTKFVNSYMDRQTNVLQANLQNDELMFILFAYFHLGHLHYKLIANELNIQLENLSNSYKYYTMFLEGCEKYKEAAKTLGSEIGAVKELHHLIPLKMNNLKKRLAM